jgi:hypothetical protein
MCPAAQGWDLLKTCTGEQNGSEKPQEKPAQIQAADLGLTLIHRQKK